MTRIKTPLIARYQQMARLQRLPIIQVLYLEGLSTREICDRLNNDVAIKNSGVKAVTTNTIRNDIKFLIAEWRKDRIEQTDDIVASELARLSHVESEAWAEYAKSKTDSTEKRTRKVNQIIKGKRAGESRMEPVEVINEMSVKDRVGNPKFLEIILRCSTEKRKFLGLDKPEKVEIVNDKFVFAERIIEKSDEQ